MADNEQIRQQNEINRATGQGHDAAKRETAGMIEKLRKALEPFATFAESNVDADGWNDVGIGTSHDRIVDWFGPSDFRQARALLAESEAGVDTFVLPAHETILTSTGAEQVRPTSFVPTECPIPPTTPEEVNDILASVGLPPRPLPPPEIARRIVAPWTVYGNVRIDGKVIECAIIAVIEEERKAASEAKLSVVRYAGKRIAELEATLKARNTLVDTFTAQIMELEQQLTEEAKAAAPGLIYSGEDDMPLTTPKEVAEIQAAAYEGRIAELGDDLKLQRQANKFNHDEQWREEALATIAEQKRQLSPSPCGNPNHREADVVPERRFVKAEIWKEIGATSAPDRMMYGVSSTKWRENRRQRNLGPPCGRCIEVEKARSEALEEAKERLDALCKAEGGHPSLREIYTAIRGKK